MWITKAVALSVFWLRADEEAPNVKWGRFLWISKASKLHQKQRVHILGFFVLCRRQTDRQTEVPDRDCLNLWKDVNCDNKVRINLKIISPLSAMTHNHLAIKIMILLGFTYLITLGFVLKKYSKITGFNAYFYSNYFWHLKIARIAIFPKLQAKTRDENPH